MTTHPTDNLVRALAQPAALRADDGGNEEGVLFGEFARFNEQTEIDSLSEGRFMESIAPGAFDETVANDLGRVKVLYDHGHDPSLGNKPLGPIRSVTPTKTGMAYEVDLIDTDYNRDFVKPAARAGLLGASFRMQVLDESWHDPSRGTEANPNRLPERTIHRVGLFEFGPVTFPAYEGASSGLRSRSDEFLAWMTEPDFIAAFASRTNGLVAARILQDAQALNELTAKEVGAANGQPTPIRGRSAASARLALLTFDRKV